MVFLAANTLSIELMRSHSTWRVLLLPLSLVRFIAMIALPVHVMHDFMQGERGAGRISIFGKEFWRYCLVALSLGIPCVLFALLVIGGSSFALRANGFHRFQMVAFLLAIACVVFLLAFFVCARFSLLFCHVASGGKIRWRAAWHDTRGHCWRIVTSQFLTGLPVPLAIVVAFFMARFWVVTLAPESLPYVFSLGQSLMLVIALIVGAACSCWLYRRFAATLLNEA
ncbi:hypothetical protein C9I57_02730 [Trinickia symbiotica]|uniref:Uncharacterized protein n=1 Tax=Trinickia symbiotica TaxID=863227 RepID=A0A2T3Y1R3_9BURK|nr:hypothetical protein C9I57_02730 [Trinickia symbiotica]